MLTKRSPSLMPRRCAGPSGDGKAWKGTEIVWARVQRENAESPWNQSN